MRKIFSLNKPVVFATAFLLSAICLEAQVYTDSELKTNIQPIVNPLKTITSLEPKAFEYNTGKFDQFKLPRGQQYGLIAEDAKKVVPGIVSYSKVSYMKGKNFYKSASIPSVDLEKLVPLLIASVKEQQESIERLRAEIADLRKQLGTAKASN